MIPAAELDELLLSFCTARWQKVARIIGKTYEVLETRGSMFTGIADHVDARVAVLVGSGQLEAKGDIKRWGYSEVRLPGGGAEAAESEIPSPLAGEGGEIAPKRERAR